MPVTFSRATRRKVKLRCSLQGPSGSGKTYSALVLGTGIARAIGGDAKIAFIDSEEESSAFYADQFTFDSLSLRRTRVEDYLEAMRAAARAGYQVLIIDSLTHAWHELVAEVEAIAKARYKGNTWSAWSEGTPKQLSLINALHRYPGHVICTMRVKTEWSTETYGGSKSRPVRVGLAPEQRKGMEYEFDLVMELTPEHTAQVIKGRIASMQDRLFTPLTEEVGEELAAWLESGEEVETSAPPSNSRDGSPSNEMVDDQTNPGGVEASPAATAAAETRAEPTEPTEPEAEPTPQKNPSETANGFARRLRACTNREDFEAITAELEAADLTGIDHAFVKGRWLKEHSRLSAQLQTTV